MKDSNRKELQTILKKTNYEDSENISGCQGLGEDVGTGREQSIFRVVERVDMVL